MNRFFRWLSTPFAWFLGFLLDAKHPVTVRLAGVTAAIYAAVILYGFVWGLVVSEVFRGIMVAIIVIGLPFVIIARIVHYVEEGE